MYALLILKYTLAQFDDVVFPLPASSVRPSPYVRLVSVLENFTPGVFRALLASSSPALFVVNLVDFDELHD